MCVIQCDHVDPVSTCFRFTHTNWLQVRDVYKHSTANKQTKLEQIQTSGAQT